MGRVYSYNSEPEALRLKKLLESEDIPAVVHSFENWGYDGVFRTQIGVGEILVPDEFEKKAREIIGEFTRNEKEIPEVEDKESKILKLEEKTQGRKALIGLAVIFVVSGLLMVMLPFLLHRRDIMGLFVYFACMSLLISAGVFFSWRRALQAQKELDQLNKK